MSKTKISDRLIPTIISELASEFFRGELLEVFNSGLKKGLATSRPERIFCAGKLYGERLKAQYQSLKKDDCSRKFTDLFISGYETGYISGHLSSFVSEKKVHSACDSTQGSSTQVLNNSDELTHLVSLVGELFGELLAVSQIFSSGVAQGLGHHVKRSFIAPGREEEMLVFKKGERLGLRAGQEDGRTFSASTFTFSEFKQAPIHAVLKNTEELVSQGLDIESSGIVYILTEDGLAQELRRRIEKLSIASIAELLLARNQSQDEPKVVQLHPDKFLDDADFFDYDNPHP